MPYDPNPKKWRGSFANLKRYGYREKWGGRVPDKKVQVGDEVTLVTRAGKATDYYVKEIVRRFPDATIFAITDSAQEAAAAIRTAVEDVPEEEPPPEVTHRRLFRVNDRLAVEMPYDPAALPFLRGLPGARFERHPVPRWYCSADPADRPRILEVAKQLGLEIEEGLDEIDLPRHVRKALDAARNAGAYEHQLEGIQFLMMHKKALLADEMGLGKTFQALFAIPPGGRTLVICPASLKYNWAVETERWRPDLKPKILKGRGNLKVPKKNEVLMINYEILPPAKTIEEDFDFSGVLLICDEAHRVKNYKAKRSQATKALAAQVEQIWFLTGTPLLGKPLDLRGVLSSGHMDREVFGSFQSFVRLFNGRKNRWGGYDFGMPDPSVPQRLRRVMLRRLKDEALDLPPKVFQTIPIPLTNKRLARMLDEVKEKLERTSRELPKFEEMSEIRKLLADYKIKAMLDWVEDREAEETPMVVFADHVAPIFELEKREGWAIITGKTPNKKRQQIVTDFQAGKYIGIGATIPAAGVGFTMTRAATMLFVSTSWTPANNAQAEDRLLRIGQKADKVMIYRLVTDHPLDQHVERVLLEKQELIRRSIEDEIGRYKAKLEDEGLSGDEMREQLEQRMQELLEQAELEAAESERDLARAKINHRFRGIADPIDPDELTDGQRKALVVAMNQLAESCDFAQDRDAKGFNKPDTYMGHYFAAMDTWDDEMYVVAYDLLRKYKRQLGSVWKEIYE